jgi:lauroyl/myristoyl acyltransferase
MVELAQRTGAGILPVQCMRDDNDNYRAVAEPPIWVGEGQAAVDETVRYLVSRFESWIRERPEQWHVMVPLWPDASAASAEATDVYEEARVG